MDGESPTGPTDSTEDQKEAEKSKEPNAAPAKSSAKTMSQSESLPEDLKPAKRPKAKRQPKFPLRREYEAREALRTLAFWAFNGVLALFGLIATAYTFHIDAVGLEMGLDTRTVRSVFLPMAFVGVSFNFLAGWMSDQFRLKWVMIQMCLGIIMGLAGMLAMPHPVAWWVWIIGIGAAQGYYGVLVAVAWPRYFGRAHLGEISGVNMSSMVIASSLGPILFSLTKDYWGGSFKVGMWVCLILTVIFLALGFFVKNPQESEPDPV
jgi:MFS family permease